MSNRNLLLVEDDPQDERLTLRALNKINVANRIDVVRDGAEALDYLFCRGDFSERSADDQPAVIFLDLKLPKLTGFEVLERVRADERTCLLPVVILTSSDEQQDLITSYKLGANSYVRKPLDFTEFSKAVANLGLHWLVLNEVPDNQQ